MCVQDPFVLNHNVTSNVHGRVSERFTAEVQAASDAFSQPDFSVPTPNTPWGIARVLAAAPLVMPGGSSSDGNAFTVVMESSKLPASYMQKYKGISELKEGWSRDLCALIRKMLEDVFFFECKEIIEKGSGASQDASSDKKSIVAMDESLKGKLSTTDASGSIRVSSLENKEEEILSGASRDASSEKKSIVAMDESLKGKPNTTDTSGSIDMSSDSRNDIALTISNVSRGEIQTVNDHDGAASTREIAEDNELVLPCRSASGELRRTREDMEELDLTSDASSSEHCLQRELSDGVKMDLEEGHVGKRSSSGDLGEARISKRSRGEDEHESPCSDTTATSPTDSNADIDHVDEPSNQTTADAGQCDLVEESITPAVETANHDIAKLRSPAKENTEITVCTAAPSQAIGGAEINTGSSNLSASGSLCCLHCSAKSSVWMGRKKFKKDSSLTGLDAEVAISRMVASEQVKTPENSASNDFSFRLKFTAYDSCGKTALVVDAHPTSGAKAFSCFFMFFKSFVHKHTHLAFT